MPQNQNIQLKISNLILLLLISACAVSGDPTVTPSPSFTVTDRPATNTPSRTSAPTHEATITPRLTWTPLPTLAPDEAQALILALLRDETDCHLPCWFGVTPGETTWPEAYNFLNSISPHIKWRSNAVPQQQFVQSDSFGIAANVPDYFNPHGRLYTGFRVRDNIVTRIWADAGFSLSHLLDTYGKPSEVWVRFNPYGWWPKEFYLGVYYQELYTFALFYNETSTFSRYGYVYGCFDEFSLGFNYLGLQLWASEQDQIMTWQDVDPFNVWATQPSLEEAIGMDLETFYQTYKAPDQRPCFETPEELWPYPPPSD